MDLTKSIEPNSEQINAEDLFGGARTVTITSVEAGTKDQPVFIHVAEFTGRTYRPAKSMRRVLVAAWGQDSSTYIGRQITIYNDPTVKWAGQAVGGVRISHLSHIKAPLEVALTVTRGKRAPFVVHPLDAPDEGTVQAVLQEIENAESMPALKTAWDLAGVRGVQSHPDLVAAKDARKVALEPPVGG